jgi:outer membrane receptor for ferrienterochelin and colicin
MNNKFLSTLILFFPLFIFSQKTITISGYLDESETGEKLLGGTIYDLNSGKGTVTNDYGFYSLTLPIDSVRIRISYIGFTTQVFEDYLENDIQINFSLKNQMLNEVEILSSKEEFVHQKSEMSSIDLSMDKVKNLPAFFGENDIMKTIQLLPGVQTGSEGTSGIYVRGGGPDQNLILLDGVPVYNASHLFGFFSVFNSDAINSTKLVKGGFPARYGGRLSSVIDIKMKEGNMKKFHGQGSIGLIASKISLEGPIIKDKTSFIISARRTYLDILAKPFIAANQRNQTSKGSENSSSSTSGGYYFYDFNGKINHKINEKHRLYLSNYMGRDKAYLDFNVNYNIDSLAQSENSQSELSWGNIISALRWNYMLNNKVFINTTLRYSKYDFLISLGNETQSVNNANNSSITNVRNYSYAYLSNIEDWSAKVDVDWMPNPDHLVKFGVGDIYHTFIPGVTTIDFGSADTSIVLNYGGQNHYAHEVSFYGEDDWKVNKNLKGNAGIHISSFFVGSKNYSFLQPRLSLRYLINDKSSFKMGYSKMGQFLHLLTNSGIGLPTDLWVPATEKIKPQFSDQIAIGYARTFNDEIELSIEGYYKTMNNLIEYKDGASFNVAQNDWQEKVHVGKGSSYGLELLIEKKIGKTTGWIGYTLSWTNRQFDSINFGNTYPYRYDRRHDIGIAITHEFNERINCGIVWVYGTGNAVTLGLESYSSFNSSMVGDLPNFNLSTNPSVTTIDHINSRNNYRMPAYHRLDVSVNIKKEKKWGERTLSFGVYNAYSRQNPFYLDFTRNENGDPQLSQFSLFPLIPSITYSFKF